LAETEPGYESAVKRISCIDLALGYACNRILEAETDDEVIEQALAHARDDHAADGLDREHLRTLVRGGD
jgi:predicted small metal-binding protein